MTEAKIEGCGEPRRHRAAPAIEREQATLQFGILGSLRIEVDGAEVPLHSGKQRALLAALLIDVNAVVSTGRLADVLWGDDQPDEPARAIRTHVSRLRGVLRDWVGERATAVLVPAPMAMH